MLVGALLTLTVCFFVARALYTQWDVVRSYQWRLGVGWLLLSAVLAWLDIVLLVALWRYMIGRVSGRAIRLGSAYRISVLANLGKYIPGKLWSVMGMVYLLKHEGVPTPGALAATALHQAFTIVPGAVFVSVVLGAGVWGHLPVAAVVIGLAVSVVILYPPFFSKLLNFGLRLFRRPPITFQLSFAAAFVLFWAYILAWVLYGTSFWCMTLGLGLPPGPFWPVVAAYGAAYLIGFLALFAPGGLGVREGILAVVLAPYLPPGLSVAVAVMSRFWMTIVELTGLIPVAGGFGKSRRTS
ncbi:MAG: lysylphosphatidylglycerol synthase domain-containing protein [Candidatus Zixiibacteriota bacterium]